MECNGLRMTDNIINGWSKDKGTIDTKIDYLTKQVDRLESKVDNI